MTVEDQGYMKLIVWQKAMDLVPGIYEMVRSFPVYERFCLADQMRRAAVSVAANIAEGHGRESRKSFAYFLAVSRGSLAELHTLVLTASRLGYIDKKREALCSRQMVEIRRLINGLKERL